MPQPKIINPVGTGVPTGAGSKAGQILIRKDGSNELLDLYAVTSDGVVKSIGSSKIGFELANVPPSVITGSTIDCDKGFTKYFSKTVNGNITFALSNLPATGVYYFTLKVIHQSGTITWWNNVMWVKGQAPVFNAGKTHLFMFASDDLVNWRGSVLPDYSG
jgi:hypothetical protein